MIPAEFKLALQGLDEIVVRASEPMERHVPLRVGGNAELFCWVYTVEAMVRVCALARKHTVRWRVCWPFQDWVVREGGIKGLVIRPAGEFAAIRRGDLVWVGAATPFATLQSVDGLSAFGDWPGVPGALMGSTQRVALNGACQALEVIKGGRRQTLAVEGGVPELSDTTVLIGVGLGRKAPRFVPTAGRLFRDPSHDQAGRVLGKAKVLGTRLRDWRLCSQLPNTVVQLGSGRATDLSILIKGLQRQVERERGLKLESELAFVGEHARRQR